jgi:hypothetical protein
MQTGLMVRTPPTEKFRRMRLFVLMLGYIRKSVRVGGPNLFCWHCLPDRNRRLRRLDVSYLSR